MKLTPEMKKAHKKGEEDAKKYLNTLKSASLDVFPMPENPGEFEKKNPKIKKARKEIRLAFQMIWDMGHDFLVVESVRDKKRQAELKDEGASTTLNSPHNHDPSHAIDIVPLENGKALWKTHTQFSYLGGVFRVVTAFLSSMHQWECIPRWGADWGGKGKTYAKTTLRDYGHFSCRDKGASGYKDKDYIDENFIII